MLHMYNFDYRADFIISDSSSDLSKYASLLVGLPFVQVKKGEERYTRSGEKLNRKASLSYLEWRLHPEEELSSAHRSLEEVLFDFIRQIENKGTLVDELRGSGAEMSLEIAVRPHESYSVLTLTPTLTEALSKNGLQVYLCLVVPPGRLY